jgi:gamma-glutamyltranspeptidase/glutathione hydrolase
MRWELPYPSKKVPVLAANVVATSQPLAAQAGLRMLLKGGNAVDAALAAAATLTVVEPIMNGIGGDLYAMVWDAGTLHGLNATGCAPRAWTPEHFGDRSVMPDRGWDSVTVPGQVDGWRALSERFGRLDFATLLEPAIDYAERGFQVSPVIAELWASLSQVRFADQPGFAEAFLRDGRTPAPGELWRFPEQARTLRRIAQTRGRDFYEGELAESIVAFARRTGGHLCLEDLAAHRSQWVTPIAQRYRDLTLHEIPPNGQGIAALMALGMLEHFDLEASGLDTAATYHLCIEAMKLAFADLAAHVADPGAMRVTAADLLDPAYLAHRARAISPDRATHHGAGQPKAGGTVYLAAADSDGMMVSFIQSNYWSFGSGIVVPGTGISLHNRGANFSLAPGHPNRVAPGKRPMHTIIPGFVTRDGEPVMAFGVMGGFMQAQGHVQMMVRMADFGQNPQAMSDAPRFMVSPLDDAVSLETHTPAAIVEGLATLGHRVATAPTGHPQFGAAQLVLRTGHGYLAASDSRRDGQAVGY